MARSTLLLAAAVLLCMGSAQAIIGGVLDANNENPTIAYIQFRKNDGTEGWGCSSTFLTPTTLLTAAHCVGASDADPTKVVNATHWTGFVRLGYNARAPTAQIDLDLTTVRVPTALLQVDPNFLAYDVALVSLVKGKTVDFDFSVAPALGITADLYQAFNWTPKNPVFSLCGFGITGGHAVPQFQYPYSRHCTTATFLPTQLGQTGTSEARAQYSNYLLTGSSTSTICFGDSGSPAVTLINGKPTIVGVAAFVPPAGACASQGYYTRVDHPDVLSWLKLQLPAYFKRLAARKLL